jgi:hypothetical protein
VPSVLACGVADLRVGSLACYLHQGGSRTNRQLCVSGVSTNKFGGNISYYKCLTQESEGYFTCINIVYFPTDTVSMMCIVQYHIHM